MGRLLLPLVLISTAAGLFIVYTNPAYQGTKVLQTSVASYDEALTQSQELKKVREALLARRRAFEVADVQKLEKILPDNVDNIRLVIDINNIAARHELTLKDVKLGTVSDAASNRSAAAVGASGSAVGSVELGFTLAASYENMLAFIADIEHSLRVIDIEKLSFEVPPTGGTNDYEFTIRTFWLH